jgi:hypothetical protein
MAGVGPITNTRTLKGALVETIRKLEHARQKPVIVRMLKRCREYRALVNEWDSVSPPPDEQFETIGQIMQLLGAAMQATKQAAKDDPTIEFQTIEPLGYEDEGLGDGADVTAHELALDLVPASTCSDVTELYREPWRTAARGVQVKSLKESPEGGHHALVRLAPGTELAGQKQDGDECVYVLEGCIKHAGKMVHAGGLLRIDGGTSSGTLRAVGEATLLLLDSERRALRFHNL